jgi:ketosteroid isomerase-like protein
MSQHTTRLNSNTLIVLVIAGLTLSSAVCGGWVSQDGGDVEATVVAGVAATQQAEVNLQVTIAAAVEATQAAAPTGLPQPTLPPASEASTPAVPTPASVPDPQQVRQVIFNEVSGAIAQDLEFLKSLYTPDAVVIDHNGTPADPSDDTTWRGWVNIERRYRAFFAAGFSSLNLIDLTIQMDGDRATGTHAGVVLDGTAYPDQGVYALEKVDGRWLITRLEFGNEADYDLLAETPAGATNPPVTRDDGLYVLKLGSQHRYEEPWGWDRGNPCEAWARGNFDDTKPDYRGFNVELLLTNNTETKVPDDWPVSFTTANGKQVQACYYGYRGSGPEPGATSSVTFFTVVEKGDYVERITFSLNGQTIQLCLDGVGGWSNC